MIMATITITTTATTAITISITITITITITVTKHLPTNGFSLRLVSLEDNDFLYRTHWEGCSHYRIMGADIILYAGLMSPLGSLVAPLIPTPVPSSEDVIKQPLLIACQFFFQDTRGNYHADKLGVGCVLSKKNTEHNLPKLNNAPQFQSAPQDAIFSP